MRIFIGIIIILTWSPIVPADDDLDELGKLVPFAIAGYSVVSLAPALIEYNRHEESKTSLSSIYIGGFVGGVGGIWLGTKLTNKTDFISDPMLIIGSSLIGMVIGNRLGHYIFQKYRVKNVSFYPMLRKNDPGFGLSLNY